MNGLATRTVRGGEDPRIITFDRMPFLSGFSQIRLLLAVRFYLALPLAMALGVASVSAAATKSAEDFVGPNTVQPLPEDAAKQGKGPAKQGNAPAKQGNDPAKTAPAKPDAPSAAQPTAPGAKSSGAPAPVGKPITTAPAAKSPPPAPAKTGTQTGAVKPVLDTGHIHSIYLDGDFDQAIRLLNGALKGKKPLTHNDSVFIYKHLGVIYAATPSTREKGRYFMLQLISIEPTAKILDMYASDMIYLIFRNVQEEFENKHGRSIARAPAVDTVPAPLPMAPKPGVPEQPTGPANAASQKSDRGTLYWVAGGAAVTAGVAGLVFILLDNPKPKKHNIVLEN